VTRYTLEHFDISNLAQSRSYKSSSTGRKQRVQRIREEHGPMLADEYENAFSEAQETRPADLEPDGVVLEIELSNQVGIAKLERVREKTRQAALQVDENDVQRVALIVPDEKKDVLATLIDDYAHGELKGEEGKEQKPPNDDRVSQIEHIRKATFETFWRDDPGVIPEDPEAEMWWALWCFNDRADKVAETARSLGCRVSEPDTYLRFPDVTVIPVYAAKVAIEILLFGTLGIAELRRASDSPTFFLEELQGDEHEWADEYAERVIWPGKDTPTVCLLDTGVNRGHPLLEPAIAEDEIDAIKAEWGSDDHHGHGTGLAGLALHGDLVAPLADVNPRELRHRAESVKIMPPEGFDPNAPNAYGSITQSAVSIAEINNADAPIRVFCLAVTNEARSGAEVTAWSAAIDQAAAGAMTGDEDDDPPRRLFVLTSGNIQDHQALDGLSEPDAFPAEDPSQAWNALTVGGYTDKTEIQDDGYDGYSNCAEPGELSPYSRSSYLWRIRRSPFKPDVVFEAGNRAVSELGTDAVAGLPSLSLLTTGANVAQAPFEPFWATSAAAAQASRMMAQIAADNDTYWPEMIRALLVHSAKWTAPMQAEFDSANTASERAECLRRFGHGIPNLEQALASANNDLALLSQRTIKPFRKESSGVKFNEAHVYALPWPAQVLEELGEELVRLKVTLSYFIEPNPGFTAGIDPARYQSHGLRFDLKRSKETRNQFLKRRNRAELEEEEKPQKATPDSGWMFGEKQVYAGSLHSDVWEGTGAELAARNMLWVYPVNGWWRERKSLKRFDSTTRYALVMTIETEDQTVDLYTPIEAVIPTLVDIPIN